MAKKLMFLVVLGLVGYLPSLAQDMANGKAKYMICQTCHMDKGQGNKAMNAPAIAGQEAWYLERQIKYFKEGLRGKHPKDIWGLTMVPMMGTLTSEKDVKDVAAYIAAMKPAPREPATVKGDLAKGKAAYMICQTCHGADGKGMKAMNAPNLTLQQDWYLERQIRNYKDGIRGSDPKDIWGAQMKPMIATLADDAAIKNVVAYIMSLK